LTKEKFSSRLLHPPTLPTELWKTLSSLNIIRAFIPAYKVLRTEVIQDILVEIDIEIIRSNIEASRCKILDIQRFNRRVNQNGKSEYIPSKTLSNLQVKDFLPKGLHF